MIRKEYMENDSIPRLVNSEEKFPIEQSYVNLAMLETKEQQEKEKKLEQAEREKKQGHINKNILGTFEQIYDTKTSINVEDIFEACKDKKKKQVLVLGRAGIGKSTFCQYVTYRWAKGEIWQEYQLVVLLRLRSLTENRYPLHYDYSLFDLVKKEYFPCEDLSEEDKRHFQDQCKKGHVLWILDGYDEFAQSIPEQLKDVFKNLREKQHHILTSRPYAVAFAYHVKMEITGFTDQNIVKYVTQFFHEIRDDSKDASFEDEKLLNFLKSNRSIWGVAHIPVNLELICSAWSNTIELEENPLTLAVLYDKIAEWLCRRHLTKQNEKWKTADRENITTSCQAELRFLESLAFNAMQSSSIILSPKLLTQAATEATYSLSRNSQILNIGILRSYENRPTGTNIETEKQHYFVHLSFQEYFAARHLLQGLKSSDASKALSFIKQHKYNQRYNLVFIFASGLLAQTENQTSTDRFWSTIQGEPKDLVGLRHIKLLIECIDEHGTNSSFSPQHNECLDSIAQWFETSVCEKPYVISEHLSQSLRRTISIGNEPRLRSKMVELMQSQATHIKVYTMNIISNLPISTPQNNLISEILLALKHEDYRMREGACEALAAIGEKAATNEVINGLVKALNDEDLDVRGYACQALGSIGEKVPTNEVINGLVKAFNDEDLWIREGTRGALVAIGKKAATNEVIDGLVKALNDEHKDIRRRACEVLRAIGEKAATNEVINGLVKALNDENEGVRWEACEALAAIGEKAATNEVINGLVKALNDEHLGVRGYACQALGSIGKKVPTNEVINGLVKALDDGVLYVRQGACGAFRAIGEKAATNEVINGLVKALNDEHEYVRKGACRALAAIGEKAATNEVINGLVKALNDEHWHFRQGACEALGSIGEKAAANEVINGLVKALNDERLGVRRRACEALGSIGEKAATNEVINGLIKALNDEDLWVREGACEALGSIGEKAATNEVINGLVKALNNEHKDIRRRACEALGSIGERAATNEVINGLVKALNDEHEYVRIRACEALAAIGEKAATNEVINGLFKALSDEDLWDREGARKALAAIGEKAPTNEVINGLVKALNDEDWDVRQGACEALGSFGEKAATNEVINGLVKALNDEHEYVRRGACEALAAIGEKAATNEVINGLVSVLCVGEDYVNDGTVTRAFEKALCSYRALKTLDSNMISKIDACVRRYWSISLASVPPQQFIKLYVDTKEKTWLSLARYVALLHGSAVTVLQNDNIIVIHAADGDIKVPVSSGASINKFMEGFGAMGPEAQAETGTSSCLCMIL